jgi:hypothetical protein
MPSMTVKLTSLAVAWPLGLLVALGFPSAAAGDAEPARAHTETASPGVSLKSDALVAHLRELEVGRRAARTAALKEPQSWADNRPTRAAQHRQQLAELWGNVVGSIDAQASLRMNADRMARLNRMLDLAEQKQDAALSTRLQADLTRELARHAHAMQQVIALTGSQ